MDELYIGTEQDILSKVLKQWEQAVSDMGHINLLVTGKTGAGKSTLINAVFREEIAKTGIGRPVTENTRCYESGDLPLRVYDTKGLELSANAQGETMSEIRTLIQEKWKAGTPGPRFTPAGETKDGGRRINTDATDKLLSVK